ncbi:MAG: hypothetical protein HY744_30045 [Deltaproteobacteria bacterium]|nr:hypothetical protein [Deltaproteobacteria bacterium]
MSITEQIADLERLVVVDRTIRELGEQIGKERQQIDGVRAELGELETRLAADSQSTAEMDKTRLDLVQELRLIDKQLQRSRERLQRARNEREANAAERELDELRKLQRDRDEEVKKITELGEQARASMEQSERRQAELRSELEGSSEGVARSVAELETRLEAARQERKLVAARLPVRLLRRYDRLSTRLPAPVAACQQAEALQGTCLGCHIQLPPAMFHRMLSRTQFEECPNCHRIIYYRPAEPEGGAGPPDGESS